MRILPAALLSAFVAALASAPTPARAETVTCTPITSLPITITSQGVYCLSSDLSFPAAIGSAISIQANNVTLDCNGRSISAMASGMGTQSTGVRTATPQSNLIVRNCTLVGFGYGMSLIGGGALLEDNRLLYARGVGIDLYGDNYTLRRNQVREIGGGTAYPSALGIKVNGSGEVRDNLVGRVHATTTDAAGILMFNGQGANIAGNRVHDVQNGATQPSAANGIGLVAVTNSSVRDNVVVGSGVGNGLACTALSRVAFVGNHIQHWILAASSCVLNGPGNVTP